MKKRIITPKVKELFGSHDWWQLIYWKDDWKFIWGEKLPKDFKPDYWWRTWRVGPIELRHYWIYISHKSKKE